MHISSKKFFLHPLSLSLSSSFFLWNCYVMGFRKARELLTRQSRMTVQFYEPLVAEISQLGKSTLFMHSHKEPYN